MRALAVALAVGLLGLGMFMLVLFAADVGGWLRFAVAVVLTGLGATFLIHELLVGEPEPTHRERGLP